jgi:hypothetical protein
MEPTIVSQSASFKAEVSLEYVDLGEDLAVFRVTRSLQPEGKLPGLLKRTASSYITQGFASTTGLREHAAGNEAFAHFPESQSRIRVVPEGFLDLVARYGFSKGYDMAQTADKDFDANQPYTDLVEKHAPLDRVLTVEHASHMVFDRNGLVLPTAIQFDYISAGMSNACYDIHKAAAHLSKNDRVHFLDRYGEEGSCEILPVESYNATQLSNRYLHFRYQPTVEEQRRLWEKQLSYGTDFPSTKAHRAVFDLDLLGLRAAGIAYYEDFHDSREYDDEYKARIGYREDD